MEELIQDLPSGPLDEYRKKSTFSWKDMKKHLFSSELIKISKDVYEFLENEPIFQPPDHDLSLEEQRNLTFLRIKKVYSSLIFYPEDFYKNFMKQVWLNCILGSYDWSLLTRKGLLKDFALSGIFGLGTEKHYKYLASLMEFEMGFAFCLTEISHGTNSKALRTEARYNPDTRSFVIHTPDFEAAKCWAGCLGKTASHCLVFAQLYTPDNICHGLHCFIVPVRDTKTLLPFPGVTIMDMGPKLGLNGLDNGVVIFNHYSIPKENLLNKTGDVNEDGVYVTPFKDPSKRFGASLGNLSLGRVSIIGFGLVNLQKALTIAVRYSAVRKQFGPEAGVELPIIEYPLQQWRLFPYLAGLYCLHTFFFRLLKHWETFQTEMWSSEDPELAARFGQEMHAVSSAGKPYSSWLARDAIQECREACGGHGYLKAAGIGHLRDDNDANCTYEGDNNVLLQQTSNWLLSVWQRRSPDSCLYPMNTCDFFGRSHEILDFDGFRTTSLRNLSNSGIIDLCIKMYEGLICWLCEVTTKELNQSKNDCGNAFTARNHSQIYRANSLSIVYFERILISWFNQSIGSADSSLEAPLGRLCTLFALTRLLKHVDILCEGGILSTNCGTVVGEFHGHVKRILRELLPDAVALVDACAPSDFVLASVLGKADGKVYEHLYQSMVTAKGALNRDSNWKMMIYNQKSKL